MSEDRITIELNPRDGRLYDRFRARLVTPRPGQASGLGDLLMLLPDLSVLLVRLLRDDRVGLGRYQAISLLRRFAVGGRARGMRLDLFLETGHADFEKFIQIAGDDTQEAQTFKQGHTLVFRLGQNASVERQKTQLAVEIILGRKAGFLLGMSHRASSM